MLPHTGAAAVGAGCQAVVHDFLLDARGHFLERDAQADAHVAALLTHRAPALALPAEERAEDVAHAAEAAAEQIVEVDVAAATAARGARNGAEAVVLGALVRVGQHVVGLVQLLELVFGVGSLVHVGVQLTRAAAERLLDFGFGGVFRHPENLV